MEATVSLIASPTNCHPCENKRLQPNIWEINIQNQPFSRATWVYSRSSTLKILKLQLLLNLSNPSVYATITSSCVLTTTISYSITITVCGVPLCLTYLERYGGLLMDVKRLLLGSSISAFKSLLSSNIW